MRYLEAYSTFHGKSCILSSPSWGSYICDDVEVYKPGDRQKWKASGTVKNIVSLPIQDRPPFLPGHGLTVSDGNIELNDIDEESYGDYSTALEKCLLYRQQQIIEDSNQVLFYVTRPEYATPFDFRRRQTQLDRQIQKCRHRSLLNRPYLCALDYVGRQFTFNEVYGGKQYKIFGISAFDEYSNSYQFAYSVEEPRFEHKILTFSFAAALQSGSWQPKQEKN